MIVRSVYEVRNRGTVIAVEVGDVIPKLGGYVVRKRDGYTARIRGIERHRVNRELMAGDKVGLLAEGDWADGDEVELRCAYCGTWWHCGCHSNDCECSFCDGEGAE